MLHYVRLINILILRLVVDKVSNLKVPTFDLSGYFFLGRLEKSQNERLSSSDSLKTIAFSVYTHSRVVLPDIVRGILPKSMTRFGPASAMVDLLNELERKEPIYYKVFFHFYYIYFYI